MNFPVELSPALLAKAKELQLIPEDVDEQFIRGSGPGGQKMNKTASTVQVIHRPTGLEVRCQQHREQSLNRIGAWKLLILKLEDRVKGVKSERMQRVFKLKKQKAKRTRRAQEKVLEAKRRRGETKEFRRDVI